MLVGTDNAVLLVVRDGALVSANRLAVSATLLRNPQIGLLTIYPGDIAEERRPVRIVGRADVPPHTVAIGADLAGALGLEHGGGASWELRTDGFQHVVLQELSLEMTVEQPLERAVEELGRSKDLCGTLLLLGTSEQVSTLSIESEGSIYRVRSLAPRATATPTVFEIGESTRLQLFAPGAKSGVDIVILADCSGSMDVSDLAETEPAGGLRSLFRASTSTLTRSEALRRALRHLLELRLSLAGRVSRIALVAFNNKCVVRFPRGGGMREIDENSPPELIQEFRDAIGLLRAENAYTDIGQALQYAAELLYRNGHPANDRLAVLISDGAHWVPRGDEATGDEAIASSEPISLMSHLHHDMKIQVHAIGISNEAIFMRWFNAQPGNQGRQPQEGLIPDHALLEELVRVGGGDASRTGDSDVLVEYFSGLGTGVVRRVLSPRPSPTPNPNSEELAQFASASTRVSRKETTEVRAKIDALSAEIRGLYRDCNDLSVNQNGQPLFRATHGGHDTFFSLSDPVIDEGDFRNFIIGVDKLFWEARDLDAAKGRVKSVINNDRLRDLHVIRIVFAHDTELPAPGKNGDHATRRKRYGETLRRLIGVAHVEHDNTEGWANLHTAIMVELRDILSDLRDACRESKSVNPKPDQPATEFIWGD